MSNLTVNAINGVDVQNIAKQTARAWVNFNGVGVVAIRKAYNVASITDNGVGDYTINFITAMPDANYALSTATDTTTTAGAGGGHGTNVQALLDNQLVRPKTTTRISVARYLTNSGTVSALVDGQNNYVTIFD